jgi:CHAD domain-containing protein
MPVRAALKESTRRRRPARKDLDKQVPALLAARLRVLGRRRRRAKSHGTPEAIHDVRVATRRVQETLDLFGEALPRRERKRLRKRVKRIRRSLADLRDADVLAALVGRLRARSGSWTTPATDDLLERFRERSRRLRRALGRPGAVTGDARGGVRIAGVAKRAKALAEKASEVPATRARASARRAVGRRVARVEAALGKARSGGASDLHALRIAVKRYRYALEILEEWGVKRLDEALRSAKQVQDILGEVHDLDVLVPLLRRSRGAGSMARRLRRDRRERAREALAAIARFRPLEARAVLHGPAAAARRRRTR